MEALSIDPDQIDILKERCVVEDMLEIFLSCLELLIRTILDPFVHLVGIDYGSCEYGSFFERVFSIRFCIFGEHRDACIKTCGNRDQGKHDKNNQHADISFSARELGFRDALLNLRISHFI